MKKQFILYHWSPTKNRAQINKLGLCPNRKCRNVENFKAPYICFADSPYLAWSLSGVFDSEIKSWDLWMVWSGNIKNLKKSSDYTYPSEYRTKQRIFKRQIWYVGTREKK